MIFEIKLEQTCIMFEMAAAEQQAGVAVQHRARPPPDRAEPLCGAHVRGRVEVRTTCQCGRRGVRGQLRPPARDRLQPQLDVPAVGQPHDGQLRAVQTQRRLMLHVSISIDRFSFAAYAFLVNFCRILFLLLSRTLEKFSY